MSAARRRLLLVTPHPAWPPTHGWSVRLWNLVRRLAESVDVYLLAFTGGSDDAAQREALAPFCRGIWFEQFGDPELDPALPGPARGLVSAALRERLDVLVRAHRIDLLQIEGTELGGLVGAGGGVPTIVTAHDLGFETHLRRMFSRLGRHGARGRVAMRPAEWLRFLRYELAGLERADQIHCMSEANARLLARVAPRLAERLRVVPNGVDTAAMRPPESRAGASGRSGVLLLGSFPHPPNADAVEYFLARIWPEIRRLRPGTKVTLAGASPPDWVLALDGRDGIEVAGEVPDVRPLFREHSVLAVPLRAGSGTRIKILEAMGAGLPVVSTPVGAAGIRARAADLTIRRGPAGFAREVVRLLDDPAAAARQAESAAGTARELYDWKIVARRALAAMDELVPGCSAGAARAVDEPPPPAIELLVPWRRESRLARGFLDSLQRIDYHLPFRVRFASSLAPPEGLRAECARRGFSWFEAGPDRFAPGDLLDAAIDSSPAELFALLDPRDVPSSIYWLGHILWALQQSAPPAVVVGEILAPGEMAIGREELAARGGFPFRPSNVALRRDVWSAYPFGPRPDAMRRWPELLQAADRLLLSTPDAPVERREEPDPVVEATAVRPKSGIVMTVVVCTRERGAAIAPTLAALSRQSYGGAWEALVVDNASSPESFAATERLVRAGGERFRLVREPTVGLSAARNCGVRHSRGALVAFLDDDAIPVDGWLEALFHAFSDPAVDAAGGPVEPLWEGAVPDWLTPELRPYLSAWDRGGEAHDLVYNETPRGANVVYRRETFERYGLFSTELGRKGRSLRSCEETEFGLRLERNGRRIRYVPAARVAHRTPTARLTEEWLEARFAQQGLSEAIVDWMHFGPRALVRRLRNLLPKIRGRGPSPDPGSAHRLASRLERAAARGYLRGALTAVLTIPRW